jgi:hypothetical protein
MGGCESLTENGDTTDASDNSDIFIGVSEPTADITSVVFSIPPCTAGCSFAINLYRPPPQES